ncbi:MAG: hypothetical protein QW038_02975 [Nanopusillaceae archaeon]
MLLSILKNYSIKFSLSYIERDVEIDSYVTVREYLEILENLFVEKLHSIEKGEKYIL